MQLHNPTKRLLSGCRHAISLIENDDFMPVRGQVDVLLGEHLDFVAHYINATEDNKRQASREGHGAVRIG